MSPEALACMERAAVRAVDTALCSFLVRRNSASQEHMISSDPRMDQASVAKSPSPREAETMRGMATVFPQYIHERAGFSCKLIQPVL